MPKKIIHGLGIGLVASAVSLLLWATGCLSWLENEAWDWRIRSLAGPVPTSDRIRLVFIDQSSLDWGKEQNHLDWPWPRQAYEPLLSFCRRGGAKAVVIDLLFTEPSVWGVADDAMFGEAIASTTGFVAAVFLSQEQGEATNLPAFLASKSIPVARLDQWMSAPGRSGLSMSRAVFPIPEVATNSVVLGNVY